MGKTAVFAIGRVPVGKSVGFLGLILDVAVLGEEIGETLFRIKLNVVVRLMAQLVCAYASVRVVSYPSPYTYALKYSKTTTPDILPDP